MILNWLDRATVFAPHMLLCLSEEEFNAAAEHCNVKFPGMWIDDKRHNAVLHTWEREGALTCLVCVSPHLLREDPITAASILVHESVHIFQRLCDSIGERSPSDEFEAYSIERIAERLMREFARRVVKP